MKQQIEELTKHVMELESYKIVSQTVTETLRIACSTCLMNMVSHQRMGRVTRSEERRRKARSREKVEF